MLNLIHFSLLLMWLKGITGLKIKVLLNPCGTTTGQHHNKDTLYNCKHQLDISLKIITSFKDAGFSHLIKVETAYDERSDQEIRLLHPLLLKVENRPAMLMYPLRFQKTVNSRAYETFLHKDNVENFRGCHSFTSFSYCAVTDEDGIQIPYSEGFCCPCRGSVQKYHARGGQDCSDTVTPSGLDTEAYHSSVHCLKFDPVWYSVNMLQKPYMKHDVVIHIFREIGGSEGTHWGSVFAGHDLVIGTEHPHTEYGQVNVDYVSSIHEEIDPLQYNDNVLLIPEPNPEIDQSRLPLQMKGNATEFLVINKDEMREKGDICDKIGVSFSAFMNQPNRCNKPAQSCLGNQPMDYWLHDVERRLLGKDPEYFLSSRATPSEQAIVQTPARKWILSLRHPETHIAHVHIRINADLTVPLIKSTGPEIIEVTYGSKGDLDILSVHVYNPTQVSMKFILSIVSCNVTTKGHVKKGIELGPRQSSQVHLSFWLSASNDSAECTVNAVDKHGIIMNQRVITFRKGKICYCMLNCKCTCGEQGYTCLPLNGTDDSLKWFPMSIRKGLFKSPSDPVFIVVVVGICLLLLGILKALLAVCYPVSIGQLGLCLFASKSLETYHEKNLKGLIVQYNDNQIPVHPKTRKRVQMIGTGHLFILNLFIGFYLPLAWLHFLLIRFCKKCNKEKEPRDIGFYYTSGSLYEDIKLSQSDMDQINKDLTVSHYRKHRKDIQQKENEIIQPFLNEDLPILQSGNTFKKHYQVSPLLCTIQKEESEIDSKKGSRTSIKSKYRRPVHSNIMKELLLANCVYYNFTKSSDYIKNSGDNFSLCGVFNKEGRNYRFELGKYTYQTIENRGGPRKLVRSKPLSYPEQYTQYLTSGEVHRFITLQPQFPCLNEAN